jgi:hypothetical protein
MQHPGQRGLQCRCPKPNKKRAKGERPAGEDDSRWVLKKKKGQDNSRWVLNTIVHFSIRIFLNDIRVTLCEHRAQP